MDGVSFQATRDITMAEKLVTSVTRACALSQRVSFFEEVKLVFEELCKRAATLFFKALVSAIKIHSFLEIK